MKTPEFWASDGPVPRLLEPLSLVYSAVGAWRMQHGTPWTAPIPILCVGNVVAGGAGKTPLALSLLEAIPGAHALLRGYGGSEPGPLAVNPDQHDFHRVGDEALLLADAAPTWISRDRAAGARAAAEAGASVLVMDDGFQNPSLAKDFTFLVFDGASGIGNGRIIPGGPLREPLARALDRLRHPPGPPTSASVDPARPRGAVVIMGDDATGLTRRLPKDIPVLFADVKPHAQALALNGRKVVAFAGIGRPAKFFATLRGLGARVVASHPFADHYPYAPADIQPILDEAFALGAVPVTTAKDAVRLTADQRQQVDVARITAAWRDPDAVAALLAPWVPKLGLANRAPIMLPPSSP